MPRFLKILSFFLCFGSISSFLAQSEMALDTLDFYVIEDNYPIQELFSKTKVLYETDKTFNIDEILNSSDKNLFQSLDKKRITEVKSVWLQVSIFPKQKLSNQHIIIKRDSELFRYQTSHDSLGVYYVQGHKIIDSTKSGVYIPASQKKDAFPPSRNSFPIDFQEGKLVELYIHIYSFDPIFTQLELRDSGFPIVAETDIINVFFPMAFATILAIYVLAFFFYTKDRSYLYLFGFYVFEIIHYQFLIHDLPFIEFLFPESPVAGASLWTLSTVGADVFFLQFGRKFTNLRKISPLWDKIVIGVIGYMVLSIIVQMSLFGFNINPLNHIQSYFAGIGFVLVLVVTIRLCFYRNNLLRYFVFASLWSFFFSILGILWLNDIIPFWNKITPWAIASTGLMFILALAIARKMQLSERAKSEVEKVREIDAIKSKFFANISHEFRTPLSLILGPINQSLENIPATEAVEEMTEIPVKGKHLNVMKRSALRLLNLVDQILDLSKLDQGQLKLQVKDGNLIQFLRAVVFSFESLTELKHIQFKTRFPKDIEGSFYDKDKLEKILVNLLSNAIKFTPEHGKISVNIEDTSKNIKISITDSGNGLKTEEVDKIFDRFYQTETMQDQGTGIGLALVKELVDLYHGQISVDSTEGAGTTFKVLLPYLKTDFNSNELVPFETEDAATKLNHTLFLSEDTTTTETKEKIDLPLLLIVEDNPDLRSYIAEQMEAQFNIITAKDGKEGFSKATVEIPDIIISDVMMPKMNGFELCENLKNDVKTSHIPIILLTAKAEQSDKFEGLETGADDYITKPFDGRELNIRAKNLIQQREKLKEKFSGELKIRPSEVTLTSMDERFMNQVINTIEEYMGNEFYTVEDLASEVGFSRSQLNRKLKTLIGKSPNQLIREFRLIRAKELLEQKTASVSEIAYQVGYSNLSYFSKSYKDTFGILPSES